jgi:hypothetical protein
VEILSPQSRTDLCGLCCWEDPSPKHQLFELTGSAIQIEVSRGTTLPLYRRDTSRQSFNGLVYRSRSGHHGTEERRAPSIERNDGQATGAGFGHYPSSVLVHAGEQENVGLAKHQVEQPCSRNVAHVLDPVGHAEPRGKASQPRGVGSRAHHDESPSR